MGMFVAMKTGSEYPISDDCTDVVPRHAQEPAAETELDAAYREMANDAEREQAATERSQALIGDIRSDSSLCIHRTATIA